MPMLGGGVFVRKIKCSCLKLTSIVIFFFISTSPWLSHVWHYFGILFKILQFLVIGKDHWERLISKACVWYILPIQSDFKMV